MLCVDNFFTGARHHIAHLLDHKQFELLRHDITHPLFVEVDEIFNLACPASPIHYQKDPVQTTKTSVIGSINMLGLAKRLKIKVLQASTSEVYGDPEVHPQPESYRGSVNPIGPRACYDEGKRAAETLFMDYHRMHKLDVRIVTRAGLGSNKSFRIGAGDSLRDNSIFYARVDGIDASFAIAQSSVRPLLDAL